MFARIIEFFTYNSQNPIQFNSPSFLIFIALVFFGYPYVVKKVKLRTIYLLAFSLFFFYKTSGIFWLLLLGTALINFILGRLIYHNKSEAKIYLVLSIIWNLASLSYFKYTNYIIEAFNSLSTSEISPLNIIFPAGISFFTFQTMSYTIDIYRKKLKPVSSFLDFAFFVSFFPQLVAGPIVRAADFLPQINKQKKLSNTDISESLLLILNGLFKKILIADFLALHYIQSVFANPTSFDGITNLLAVYAYAMKIYCDFSAYSDMAIGLARLLGFKLLENFNFPYRALSVKDFWSRWHISLSTWLRDYLYIPLGGNRKGNVYLHLMITMLLGGLWHVRPNAFWTYITWGCLHGLALVVHRIWFNSTLAKVIRQKHFLSSSFKAISWLLTFNFICLTWVFFRADTVQNAWIMLTTIFSDISFSQLNNWFLEYKFVSLALIISYFFHFIPSKFDYNLSKYLSKFGIIATSVLLSIALIFLSEFTKFERDFSKAKSINNQTEIIEDTEYKVQQFEYYKF